MLFSLATSVDGDIGDNIGSDIGSDIGDTVGGGRVEVWVIT